MNNTIENLIDNGILTQNIPAIIDESILDTINGYLHRYCHNLENEFCINDYWYKITELLGNEWLVTHGEICGTFPKRLAKIIYKICNVKLDTKVLGIIGDISSAGKADKSYYFDITNKFNWDAGDFGDGGSCYWTCRSKAREVLTEAGGMAMRMFKDKNDFDSGYGRCWILPHENGYILFNAYPSNFKLVTFARILSTYCGLIYNKIHLTNRGSDSGLIWINNASGYFLNGVKSDIECVDLDLDSFIAECYHCGDEIIEEDNVYTYNDNIYCESCYDDLFIDCDNCGNACDRDDITFVDNQALCEYCYDRLYTTCCNCNEDIKVDATETHGGDTYCYECFNDLFFTCNCCGKELSRDYEEYYNNDTICTQCKEEKELIA